MAQVVYTGFTDAVLVPLDLGGEILCVKGVATSVPDDLAARLLEQPNVWAPAPSAAPVVTVTVPVKTAPVSPAAGGSSE